MNYDKSEKPHIKVGSKLEHKTEPVRLTSSKSSQIAHYKNRFRKSPGGCWSEASGTFGMIMNDVWEFNDNHTGSVTEYMIGGIRSKRLFEWKEIADFTIACRHTEIIEGLDDLGEEANDWVTITYDFDEVTNDCGTEVGMMLFPELDDEKDHYEWSSRDRLAYFKR